MVTETNPPPGAENYKVTAEIGRTGIRRYGGQIADEFDPNLRGVRGMRKFDEMRRNDPDVGAILIAMEMSMLSVDWTVEKQGESPADVEAAEFLESCMLDMSLSWKDFLSDVLTMLPFGFELGEIVYKLRDGPKSPKADIAPSKYDDGRIGWRKISIRNQETIEKWDFDDGGGLRGVWQSLVGSSTMGVTTTVGQRVYLPIDKCLLFTTRRERGNPEGYSLLRNAYRSYYDKTNLEEIEVISAERDMTGIPFIKLPVGADEDDKDAALDILEKLKWDDQAGIVLPRQGAEEHTWWEFGTVQSPGSPRIDINTVIQRKSISIARSVLAQFLTLGQGRVGSYALSKDMRDLFHLAVKGWLDRMEETINRFLVDRLFSLNDFGQLENNPQIRHGRMGQRAIDQFVEALNKLATMGMPLTLDDWNFVRTEMEMPVLPDDVMEEILNAPAPTPEEGRPAPTEDDEEDSDQDTPQSTKEPSRLERWFSRKF